MATQQQSELSLDDFLARVRGKQPEPQAEGEELSQDEFLRRVRSGAQPETKKKSQGPEAPTEKAGFLSATGGQFLEGVGSVVGELEHSTRKKKLKIEGKGKRRDSVSIETEPPGRVPLLTPAREALQQGAEAVYPEATRGTGGFLEQLGGGLGSIGAGVAGMATGLPGASIFVFGAQNGMPAYYEVLKATGDEEKAGKALLFGNLTGQLEHLGVDRLAGGIVKKLLTGAAGEGVRKIAMGIGLSAAKNALTETGTEMAQQALGDLAYERLTGEDLANWERIKQVIGPSAVLGGLFGAIDAGIEARRAKKAPGSAQETTSPEVRPTAPLAEPTPESIPGAPEASQPAGKTIDQVSLEAQKSAGAANEVTLPTEETVQQPAPEVAQPEATPEQEPTTGIKNRTVEAELEKMGAPLPEKAERRGFVEIHAKAQETLNQNPEAGRELVDDLEKNPRPPTDEEDALLTFEANRLINEREAAEKAFIKNPTDENQKRIEQASQAYIRAANAMDRAGTESGRSLNARKMMLARDYSLAEMERKVVVAKNGAPLTKAERVKISELHEKIAATQKALDEHISQSALREKELEARALMAEAKAFAAKEARSVGYKKRKASIAEAKRRIDEITRQLASDTKAAAGLDPNKVVLTAKLAKEYVNLGYQNFRLFSDEVVAKVGEHIRPYLQKAWDDANEARDQEMLARYKARKEGDIQRLKERTEAKVFETKRRKTPVEKDQRAIELKAEHEIAKRAFEAEREKARRASRTAGQKAAAAAKEILDLPRALMSSFDLSAVRRQGGFFTLANPLRSGRHMARMLKALANPRAAVQMDVELRSRPNAALGEAAGLELTSSEGLGPQEEAIRSQWSDKIPGVKASNRAYVTYLNLQRAAAFDAIIDSLPGKPSLETAKAVAEFVNVATGRASGKGKKIATAIEGTKLLWAPSYVVSRFQLLSKPFTTAADKRLPFKAKRKILGAYTRYAAGQAAYYALVGSALSAVAKSLGEDFDVEKDPRSSDFGKIRVGNTRLDPLSGLAQVGVFLTRMVRGETKTLTGRVKELKKGGPFDSTRLDVAMRFGRSKLGPIPGRIADALAGETFVGEPVTPTQALTKIPWPLSVRDMYETFRELGAGPGLIFSVFSILGEGVQTFDPTKKKTKK